MTKLLVDLLCGRTAGRSTPQWQNCCVAGLLVDLPHHGRTAGRSTHPMAELLYGWAAGRSSPPNSRTAVWQNYWQIYPPWQNCYMAEWLADLPPNGRTAVWQTCCVVVLLIDLIPHDQTAGRSTLWQNCWQIYFPKWQNCCEAECLCGRSASRSTPKWKNCCVA